MAYRAGTRWWTLSRIGIVYAGMRLPLRPSAAGATTVRTPAFARVPRDLAERTRGPLCMRRRRDAREPWRMGHGANALHTRTLRTDGRIKDNLDRHLR